MNQMLFKKMMNINYNHMQALKCRQKYGMGSSYNYRKQIEDGLFETIPNQIKNKCSMRKILRSIMNLLRINFFESALLGWLLKRSSFDVNTVKISQGNDLNDSLDLKVQIFILLRGYQVKHQLCDNYVSQEIQKELSQNYEQFSSIFFVWKPQTSLKCLSLNEINQIFQDWTSNHNHYNKVDYNKLATKILDLSKSYNVHDKTQDSKEKGNKKIKIQKNMKHEILKNQQIKNIQYPFQETIRKKNIKQIKQEEDFVEEQDSYNLRYNIDLNPLKSRSINYNLRRSSLIKSGRNSLMGQSINLNNSNIIQKSPPNKKQSFNIDKLFMSNASNRS